MLDLNQLKDKIHIRYKYISLIINKMIKPRTYKYINSGEDRSSKDCINENELFEFINDEKFIVQDEITRNYLVFNSYNDFKQWFVDNPNQRCLHELIRGCSPQKLKFDIDVKYNESDLSEFEDMPEPIKYQVDDEEIEVCELLGMDPYETYNNELAQYNKGINERKCRLAFLKFIEHIKETFQQLYIEKLDESDIVVSDSSDANKFSKHIVLINSVANANESKFFTRQVVDAIPKHYRFMVDQSVNKNVQLFRLPECHKKNSNRIKIITTDHGFDDMVVSIGSDYILPKISGEKPVEEHENIAPENCMEIVEQIVDHTEGHKFWKQKNNMLFYTRVKPSHCRICKRTHEKDNTLFVTIHKSRTIIHCRHAINEAVEKPKNIALCRTTPAAHNREDEMKELCEKDVIEDEIPGEFDQECTNDEFINPLRFCGDLYDTIIVKSAMGTGKTVELVSLINTLPEQVYVICISFRRSFTSEIMSKLGDTFVDYRNVKGRIENTPRLVIQYESLNRLSLPVGKQILLVIDESESVVGQIENKSKSFEKAKRNFEIFEWLMRYSSKLICMDANTSYITYDLIKKTRSSVLVYNNEYKKTEGTDVYYASKNQYLDKLYDAMKTARDKPIVICSTSKDEADVFLKKAKEISPSAKIKYYNRDSSIEERKDFDNVNAAWAKVDILIYTSTISAGISFDITRFDKVFGYFDSKSCCYKTCSQMLGRVRKVETGEYHIYVKKSGTLIPATFNEIEDAILRKDHILKNISNPSNQLCCFINEYGHREFKHKDLYYHLHINNLVHKAQSNNLFLQHLINLRKASGNNQVIYTRDKAPQSHAKETLEIKTSNKREYAEAILSVNMDSFSTDLLDRDELSYEEKLMVKQYKFKEFYGDQDIKITPEIFTKYDSSNVKNIYTSLNALNIPELSISDVIKLVGKSRDDKDTSMILMSEGNHRFKQVLTCEILNAIFTNYTDRNSRIVSEVITREMMEANIDAAVNIIKKDVNVIAHVFGKRKDRIMKDHKNLREKIMLVNSIIDYTIDAKIVGGKARGKADNFTLRTENLFKYQSSDSKFVINN